MPFLKKKITVIYNGIVPFQLVSQIEARKALAPNATERLCIGTISELHTSKGLDYLIDAFALVAKKYANVVLIIVGSGEKEEELKAQMNKLGIEKHVTFAGFVPDARKYLKAFDIFTLTSRTEALPYVPLEAGLAMLPVVASWAGGIPEIITNDESGLLVEPSDTEKLALALENLIEDEALRKNLAQNLHQTVITKFTIQKMLHETIALY